MATRIRKVPTRHYPFYIADWLVFRDIDDEELADKLGVSRETVTRWANHTRRPGAARLRDIAAAFDCNPDDLLRPPPTKTNRPSIDQMLKDASDDVVREAAEHAAILLRRQ